MATQADEDGQVVQPLNITAPTPVINLKGFEWTTVDDKYADDLLALGVPANAVQSSKAPSAQQEVLIAESKQFFHRGPPAPPASAGSLPEQIAIQLGLASGRIAAPAPEFPLSAFQGSYAGNGFNMIFRPRGFNDQTSNLDNILQLSLTTEQLTFGSLIGKIPNRGLNKIGSNDIELGGFPYLQTIQDVTDAKTGRPTTDKNNKQDIHFEPGMWLTVPSSNNPEHPASIVRMGSIPHGTTIHAQSFAPARGTEKFGGNATRPVFDEIDTTPFSIGNFKAKQNFDSMDATRPSIDRLPPNLDAFDPNKIQPGPGNVKGSGLITTKIIKNPNLVLQNAIEKLKILETTTFEVSTEPPAVSTAANGSVLGGSATANISFLVGSKTGARPGPNAHAVSMKSKFWIEVVEYDVEIQDFGPAGGEPREFTAKMPDGSTAPTPRFRITPPPKLPAPLPLTIKVPGLQIQYSQTVNLNFFGLTWPHVSVATLVPTGAQTFVMT